MRRFRLDIRCHYASFHGDGLVNEISDILHQSADYIKEHGLDDYAHNLRDSTNRVVGSYILKE